MIPDAQALDVCIRPSKGSFPKSPLLARAGQSCPSGVSYSQYTIPFAVESGTYDVMAVPWGHDCSDDLAIAENVTIASGDSTTVVVSGLALTKTDTTITALKDANDPGTNVYLRFFNALNGTTIVQAGLAGSPFLPATIYDVEFPEVSFGSIAAASNTGTFEIDDRGYLVYQTAINPGALFLGAGAIGTTDAIAVTSVVLATSQHITLFFEGLTSDSPYPPKLWSCDEGATNQTYFARCGDPRELSIGIFNPNLTDLFTDYINVRTQAALDAIASATADVLCTTELYSPALRSTLRDKVAADSGATILFSDDAAIAADSNLNTQSNVAPNWPKTACADDDANPIYDATNLAKLRDCLASLPCIQEVGANSDASAPSHHFVVDGSAAVGCVSGLGGDVGCGEQLQPFIQSATHDSDICYMCAITHLSSGESVEDMYQACTAQGGDAHYVYYVYGGSTGLAILMQPSVSLAPGESPEVVLLPASNWNRAAFRVPIKLQNNAIVDFWCTNVRPPNKEVFIKNSGPYFGAAPAGDSYDGNAAEENLQIARMIAAINDRSQKSHRRAIIAALTYASPAISDAQGNAVVSALAPENFKLISRSIELDGPRRFHLDAPMHLLRRQSAQ